MSIPSTILLVVTLSAFLGCNRKDAISTSSDVDPSWGAARTTDGSGYEVSLKPSVDTITRNDHFSLDVEIAAKDGSSDSIGVVVDADMPAHRHGMNTRPETTETEPGKYRVDGMALHMAGDWVITVDVTKAGRTERAVFPITIE